MITNSEGRMNMKGRFVIAMAAGIVFSTAAFAGVDKQDEAPGETEAPKT